MLEEELPSKLLEGFVSEGQRHLVMCQPTMLESSQLRPVALCCSGKEKNMRYVSTRGAAVGSLDFEGALFSGYAADGGLLMPETIPVLDHVTLQKWSVFSYPELVKCLCPIFISAELIPKADLHGTF